MFTSLGLFKNVPCPKQGDCNLINCIFLHPINASEDRSHAIDQDGVSIKATTRDGSDLQRSTSTELYDPLSAGTILETNHEPPPPKRRRLETPIPTPQREIRKSEQHPIVVSGRESVHDALLTKKPASIARPVSPPLPRRSQATNTAKPLLPEKLIPRQVPKAPAVLKTRLSLLEVMHKHIKQLNTELDKASVDKKELILTDQEVIKLALEEEEQAALKLSSDIYRNALSQTILRFKKMNLQEWKAYVTERCRPEPLVPSQSFQDRAGEDLAIATGLLPAEEIMILKHMQTHLVGLEEYGYVTSPITKVELDKAKAGTEAAGGYESCDRCGTRFQVFPGRDSQGRLTTQGRCYFHWAKINRFQSNKQVKMHGQNEATYPCCNQSAGSEGCTEGETHVFKVTDAKRLASLLQFERTPAQSEYKSCSAVAFDCEMGYTTYGLELIRLTAISWPDKHELLDVLVRPYGEILDLNTRFSGVSKEQFANAAEFVRADLMSKTDLVEDDTSKEGEISSTPAPQRLQKVSSVSHARQLLFDFLAPSTALIGHAIDNDLNATRIIHPFVVDTVLLYPHPRGLPIRYGLKMLSAKYLKRGIQQGGDAGHDSKEDSIATGDLVRVKVKQKWEELRQQGWSWEAGVLTKPMKNGKLTNDVNDQREEN